jgi:hypothetical protein
MSKYSLNSSFWMDNDSNIDVLTGLPTDLGKDLVKLSAHKRAISNFVNIVTGENIPVTFQGKDSYTDGKSVVIGSNLKDGNFDVAVGLALHEGSHIKLTDFNTLSAITALANKRFPNDVRAKQLAAENIKSLVNIIEDRRIDYFIFKSSPGYKGYYHAMYDKYFNAAIIDKALKLGEKSQESWDDYLFHICNFQNKNRSLSTLKGLQYSWDSINLKNISRLKDTNEVLDLSVSLFDYIESILPEAGTCEGQSQKAQEDFDKKFNSPDGGNDSEDAKDDKDGDSNDDGSRTTGETVEDDSKTTSQLSDKQQKQLESAIEKQKDFIEGSIKKSSLSKKDLKTVDALEKSGCSSTNVGAGNWEGYYGKFTTKGIDCLVLKDLTQSLVDADEFSDIIATHNYWSGGPVERQEAILKGIRLGTMLGRKLQVRNEERTLKTTRLPKGRIDKRMISALGYGAENVFSVLDTQKYKNALVHISIDASGSMSGDRFLKSQTSAVAIAKAASMTKNFDVQISYRSTHGRQPLILIAYDSKKDNIKKLTSLLKFVYPGGTTPEGLCFEAIQDHLLASTEGMDSYFINFSDGQPYFNTNGFTYNGIFALNHTAKEVKKMTQKGIKILSFFIDGGNDISKFQRMYGKSAKGINVDQLLPLAKELNKMFI